MSEANPAVFLSYASQDVGPAERIAKTLRAHGLEVWFDKNELTGGDAWDQKIRDQIKSCLLFLPIISANTQARTEGYFRLEWRLADQRTHLMARGRPFLVPIVIDQTGDAEALVPDSFTEVQWSRFPEGLCDEQFPHRLKTMMESEVTRQRFIPPVESAAPASDTPTAPAASKQDSRWWLIWAAPGMLVGLFYIVAPIIKSFRQPVSPPAAQVILSESDKLTSRARALLDDEPLLTRVNVELAVELAERAVTLDPLDAEVQATAAWAHLHFLTENYDPTTERVAKVREFAGKAIRLDPNSINAELVSLMVLAMSGESESALTRLAALKTRAPDNFNVMKASTEIKFLTGQFDNIGINLDALRAHSTRGLVYALAWEAGRQWGNGNFVAAEHALDEAFATGQPNKTCYLIRTLVISFGWGDLAAARDFLGKIPSHLLLEDVFIHHAARIWLYSGNYDKALASLRKTERDMLQEARIVMPKGSLTGAVHAAAGNPNAAHTEWLNALDRVDDRLAASPNNGYWMYWRASLLALLGRHDEARAQKALEDELNDAEIGSAAWARDYHFYLALGEHEEAVRRFQTLMTTGISERWPSEYNSIRHDPFFTDFRQDSRIQRILEDCAKKLADMRATMPNSS